ncbi:uncharacterized protein DUF4188 [Glaciihabitans tibetensis]|uniref:Uncharacterized protein DUF4188 n=1 Tax=Glaciihabitans tibetensis TaxID=1266600 RepID=A0A2T0VG18_9MICO|nr:DUF4188 domain-containing protein [Glaciihabitans tibetensis]PRY69141.1 uncharacterized protein DUF4188 [Glaciihabitans tibetensis]
MAQVNIGRMTHHYDGELIVFLIGMRFNRPWRVDKWLPAFLAMPRMLTELSKDPDSGLMGFRLSFSADGPVIVQYWNSREKLYDYASAPSAEHRPAWTAFNKRARKAAGAVGIWHETFQVERAESMYVGMPAIGLAHATETVPVTRNSDRARQRMSGGSTPSAAMPGPS